MAIRLRKWTELSNRKLIKGSVCGVRVETIEETLLQEIRYWDKLIDELAKGKQDHYCGLAPATIKEYIERQPDEVQPYLRQINSALKAALPDAVEKIS